MTTVTERYIVVGIAIALAGLVAGCSDVDTSALATEIASASKTGMQAGQTAIAEGQEAVETQIARRENGRRVLVLLQGMNSSNYSQDTSNATEFCTWFDAKLALLARDHGGIYDDIIHFSYAGPGEPYTAENTFQAVDQSVAALEDTISAYLKKAGHELAVFDLVGHSLGGVVAWRFASTWGIIPSNAPALYHVATMHSPVNGSTWLAGYLGQDGSNPRQDADEQKRRSVLNEAISSRMAHDLAEMSEARGLRNVNIGLARLLKAQGVHVRTFASSADVLISTYDATIPGFEWEADLGRGPLVTGCATAPAAQLDAASLAGHNQILHRGEGLVALKEFLEE